MHIVPFFSFVSTLSHRHAHTHCGSSHESCVCHSCHPHIIPSSVVTLGKLLTEAHREHADYRNPEGVSVSQSSLSVVVDRTGKLVGENNPNAQIRTLLDEKRQMIIAEYCEKIGHHELQAARAEEERRILQEEFWVSKRIFVKFINKVLLRWRNYENSRVLPWIRSQDGSSSRTRTLLWNCQDEYRNYKMKENG